MKTFFHHRVGVAMMLLILAILFSGCAFYGDLTLYANERWEYATTIELTADEDHLLGESIQQQFEEQTAEAPDGISLETARALENNTVRYTVTATGSGYTRLQDFLYEHVGGEPITIEKSEQGHMTIVFPYHDMNFAGSTLPSAASLFGSDIQSEFRLHAKEVIESNAERVENNTAIWDLGNEAFMERTTLQATIVPLDGGIMGSSGMLIVGIVVVLLLGVGGVVVLKAKRLI